MKTYNRPQLPRRRAAHPSGSNRVSALDRTRGMMRSHGERERPFDPTQRGSWRGSSRDLVVNSSAVRLPAAGSDEVLRYVDVDGYKLLTWELRPTRRHSTGQEKIGYAFFKPSGELLFSGKDYGVSPGHALDSDDALRGLLGFLTLKPGDTDQDYFDDYTPEQMAFAEGDAEMLSIWGFESEPGEESMEFRDEEWAGVGGEGPYDRDEIGNIMLMWHGGQGDPVYAVGSFYINDKDYPDKKVVQRALTEIEKLQRTPDLNDSDVRELGAVARYLRSDLGMKPNGSVSEKDLEEFMQGYLVCMLWSSNDQSDESGGDPLDDNYSIEDIDDKTLAEQRAVCEAFLAECGAAIKSATLSYDRSNGSKMEHAGHDFWLNRNGHGAGFWDGDWSEPEATILDECSKEFSEAYPTVDDGKVYIGDNYVYRSRMKPNGSGGDVPYHVEEINFRYRDPPSSNGARVRWSDFQNGSADEGHQWYSVGPNVGGQDTVGQANYNVLSEMLAEAHPRNSEPVVWGDVQGDGIIVVWELLSESVQEAIGGLENYPLISDDEHSKLENEAQEEAWDNWARREFEKQLLSSLNAEFTNDSEEIDDLDDVVGSGDLYELFNMGINVSNEYWTEESDGSMFIRMDRIADAVVEVIMGRDKLSWVDPDAKKIVQGIREEIGIEVK